MNYGLYLSAAGALTNMHRQDVYANNLANMNTVGFKPDHVYTRQRLPERLESPGGSGAFADPKWLLERLGGGQFIEPTRVGLKQGDLVKSENDLDLAIEGDGLFVVGDGLSGEDDAIRMTRDGRFTINTSGELVMTASGMNVLDSNDRPIRVNRNATVRINERGELLQNGEVTSQIQVIAAPDSSQLSKVGDNLLRFADDAAVSRQPSDARVRQGYTEGSAVDPILAMNAMMGAAKAAQSNMTMMQYHDHILGQAFNTFGRVA